MADRVERPALSLVIPAFNEEVRLGTLFTALREWISDPPRETIEIVLVDDGSDDATLARFREFESETTSVRVQVLANAHRGKGFAVRAGVLAANGDAILFSDADLSAPLCEATKLLAALDAGADLAVGSREGAGAQREREPSYRHLMGRGFNRLVQALLVPGIQDTQCGFKLFTRAAAQGIFTRLRRYGPDAPIVVGPMVTAFDVEVLFVARKLGYRISEIPVHWVHAEGSKVQPVRDAFRMARDVLSVKWGDVRNEYEP